MRVDKNKLPAKYALEVYKMVDGYPSTIDILYEVVTILQERDKLEEPFDHVDILKEVTTRIANTDLSTSLEDLHRDGWLSKDGEKYLIQKHPWS